MQSIWFMHSFTTVVVMAAVSLSQAFILTGVWKRFPTHGLGLVMASFAIGGLGWAFWAFYRVMPGRIGIVIAWVLIILGLGFLREAIRWFAHLPPRVPLFFGAAALVLVLNLIPAINASVQLRVATGSAIAGIFPLLTARDLWTCRHERLPSLPTVMTFFILLSASFFIRIPFAVQTAITITDPNTLETSPFAIFMIVNMILNVGILIAILSLRRERADNLAQQELVQQAHDSALTRSTLHVLGERQCEISEQGDRPLAVVLIEMRFNSDDDTDKPHRDRAAAFGRHVTALSGPSDILGRMGAEHFCLILANASDFEAHGIVRNLGSAASGLGQVVAIGVASSLQVGYDFTQLLCAAEAGLREAKENGIHEAVTYHPGLRHLRSDLTPSTHFARFAPAAPAAS